MPQTNPQPAIFTAVPKQIWGIGFGVFLINTSSVMVRGISAVYLNSLGVDIGWIGFLEGLIEWLSFAIKAFTGVISDYLRRRKLFITVGYLLIAVSNPILALWTNFAAVCLSRVIGRIGNGVQATPRDALVGDIAPAKSRGACYGSRVGLGIAGSFAGALIGLILMHQTNNDYVQLFWVATIPAVMAVMLVIFFIKEPKKNLHPKDHQPRHPIHWSDIPRLGSRYWALMGVITVFMIAQLGEPFLVLHAYLNFDLPDAKSPIIFLLFNATYSLSSFPIGALSDRISRYHLLALGFLILIISDLILAMATNLTTVFIGIFLWGIQMGIHQSMFFALVADNSPDDLRGTALGVYYFLSGACIFIANFGGGQIGLRYGTFVTFTCSFVIATISLMLLLYIMPKKRGKGYKSIA